ncbi:F-box only protein 9 isoform X2 [Chrysoperla carnea]|nr:F-box only protein 9 isoform X2 [Chrysoperla carnea]
MDKPSEENDDESVENLLHAFRTQWKKELNSKTVNQGHNSHSAPSKVNNNHKSDEDQAKELFLKAAELEKMGNMYEAIQHYKKSVQLIPDIEFRIYEKEKSKQKITKNDNKTDNTDVQTSNLKNNNLASEEDLDDEEIDLLSKLQKLIGTNRLCTREFDSDITHISALPMEIILYILRWVVSSDLDMQSLENFGCTCRGFYLCSRDSEIWKLACTRAWNANSEIYANSELYPSWRDMFIQGPRLKYNGCYISKTTYVRAGENSFQDQFYRPWHLVAYYRYLRFFPDGRVLMLTTPDEPAQCVSQLKYPNPRNPNVLIGQFCQHENFVTLIVQKQQTMKTFYREYKRRTADTRNSDLNTQIFQLELQIQNYKKRKNVLLGFIDYTVVTKYKNGSQTCTKFDLGHTRFPPLCFSKVKSYTAKAENILQ